MGEIGISIITPTKRIECIESIIDNYYRQEYKKKELIIIINNDEMSIDMFKGYINKDKSIKVYQLPEHMHLAECLNLGIEKVNFDYVARFDDDDYYGRKYLDEINNNFQTKQCDIINKASFYTYFKEIKILLRRESGKENHYMVEGGGATTCLKREIFDHIKYINKDRCDSILMKACKAQRYIIYSTSPYNFMAVRSIDTSLHTYPRPYREFLKSPRTKIAAEKLEFKEALKFIDNLNGGQSC